MRLAPHRVYGTAPLLCLADIIAVPGERSIIMDMRASQEISSAPRLDGFVDDGHAKSRSSVDEPVAGHGVPAREQGSSSQTKMTVWQRVGAYFRNKDNQRLLACYWALASAGWNDASLGPLIPSIERYFSLTYTEVSTLFISQCVGYMVCGVTCNRMTHRLGMGRVVTIGAALQLAGYAIAIAPPPFAVLPIGWAIIGLGVGYQDASANAWVAGLPNAHVKLGYLHGLYGLGALVAPLVATAFVSAGIRFSYFFAVSLGVAATDVLVLFLTFWRSGPLDHEEQEEPARREPQQVVHDSVESPGIELKDLATRQTSIDEMDNTPTGERIRQSASAKDMEIYKNKLIWICAIFLLLYVGAEVSIGGWIVTFLQNERQGSVQSGNAVSGFWGGIALGRLILPRFNVFVGERRVIFPYTAVAISLEIWIWLHRDLISNAVAFSLIGVILGPFYPIAISVISKLLPRHLHVGAIGFIAAIGSCGAAALPFATGALAQRYGAWVLQPMIISLLSAMGILWIFIPEPDKKAA